MGKGKGAVEYWLPLLNPEELCLKLEEFLCQLQKRRLAAQKLPVKTKFVVARDFEA
jgi:large subunit ribosomal protein L16